MKSIRQTQPLRKSEDRRSKHLSGHIPGHHHADHARRQHGYQDEYDLIEEEIKELGRQARSQRSG